MKKEDLMTLLHDAGVLPVLKIDDCEKAENAARAAIKGGAPILEMTFTSKKDRESLKRIHKAFPEVLVGAGSITNPELAEEAMKAGAAFIVCPGVNPDTIEWCLVNGITVIPGVATPSDVEKGLSYGIDVFDFFPSEAMGGAATLADVESSFPGVRFIASGGITEDKMTPYAKGKNVLSIAGSWVCKDTLINAEDWDEIERRTRSAIVAFQGFELAHIGINSETDEDASKTRDLFTLFGLKSREFKTISYFMNDDIEIMRFKGRGKLGHIAYRVYDIPRTLYFLSRNGFSPAWDSAQYAEDGSLKLIYINEEIGGFAVHLVK